MKCFCFENKLETVHETVKISRACVHQNVEMATSHTEVVQLLAARPRTVSHHPHDKYRVYKVTVTRCVTIPRAQMRHCQTTSRNPWSSQACGQVQRKGVCSGVAVPQVRAPSLSSRHRLSSGVSGDARTRESWETGSAQDGIAGRREACCTPRRVQLQRWATAVLSRPAASSVALLSASGFGGKPLEST